MSLDGLGHLTRNYAVLCVMNRTRSDRSALHDAQGSEVRVLYGPLTEVEKARERAPGGHETEVPQN
jgi:hypothetical protein